MGEQMAINRCFKGLADMRTLCDVPAGPGRLFSFWEKKGFFVTGVELSDPMFAAATKEHHKLKLEGSVISGDIFRLKDILKEPYDVVACIRFIYYFERDKRIEVLRALSAVSRHYILIQYKTTETTRGRSHANRLGKRHKYFVSNQEIVAELKEAGLKCHRIVPISRFSNRVFVLAKKPSLE
jgi:2-polyprenyl-3-methyl-5-hydroxy-6-metoxy-1,4-benzoquinol methylase